MPHSWKNQPSKLQPSKLPSRHLVALALCLSSLGGIVATGAMADSPLIPFRTWDDPPTVVVDFLGLPSIGDFSRGVTQTVIALNSPAAWNGSPQGVLMTAVPGPAFPVLGDGIPMLSFFDPFFACTGTCVAATFTGFFEERPNGTYRIFDADIVTNRSFAFTSEIEDPFGIGCYGEIYVEGVMVHEAGHLLGLGHSSSFSSSMFPLVFACDRGLRTISTADRACIATLYELVDDDGGGDPPPPPPPACDFAGDTADPGAPAAPASFTVRDEFCLGQYSLSWPAVSGATRYEVERSFTSDFARAGTIFSGSGTSTFITVTQLSWLRVRACNANGCSCWKAGSSVARPRDVCL